MTLPHTPTLRPYQVALVSRLRQAFKKHKHVLGVAAQGSGKTFCFSAMALSSIKRGYKVLIISNRAKLLNQAGGALALFGLEAEYISAKHKQVPIGHCAVAMAQTLQRRYLQPEYQQYLRSIDLFIIDEIHGQDFNFLFETDILKNKWVLGVTATPKRSGKQRQLGLDFSILVEGLSVQAGIDLGFLVPAKHFTLDAPDLSQTSIDPHTGDFRQQDLYKVFNNNARYGGVVSNFKNICNNEKTICFCVNQAHAIKTCMEFNNAGISSKFIISGVKKDDEDYALYTKNIKYTGDKEIIEAQFDRGEFVVLCNVAIYTTGYDCPGIINVILNRATLSESLYEQIIGRGSRIYNGKEFFRILDFGGNIARFGLFEAVRDRSLWHNSKDGTGVCMTKECPMAKPDKDGIHGCGRLVLISAVMCPFCGYIFKTPEEIREIELREIIGGKFKFKDMTPEELLAHAELHGYHKGWVFRQLYMGNTEPLFKKAMRELGYDSKFIYTTLNRLKR